MTSTETHHPNHQPANQFPKVRPSPPQYLPQDTFSKCELHNVVFTCNIMQNLYICVDPLYFPCPFLQETPREPIIDFSLVLTVFTRVKNQGSTCQQPKSKDGLGKDGLSNLKIRKTPNLLPVFTHPSLLARPNPKVKTVCKDGHFTSYLPVFTLPVFTCWNEFRRLVDSHGPIELP